MTDPAHGQRTHPATAFVRVWVWLVAAVVGSLRSFQGEHPSWTLAAIAGAVIVLGIAGGAASWWFTRYVIDGSELRIDSGVVTKRSRRIPYERLQSVDIAQPFAARMFGLAELRIEMAGGDRSRAQLQFLRYDDARALRQLLLDRAAGQAGHAPSDRGERPPGTPDEVAEPTHAGPTHAGPTPTPAREPHEVIAAVPPVRLVVGALLCADLLAALGAAVLVLVAATVLPLPFATISVLVPIGGWLVQILSKRVIAEWGFTLTRSGQRLRIERGLLSRSSQTVPYDRIQAVSLDQPLLWRVPGWRRLEVDVAGYAGESGDGSVAPSTLLPVVPAAQADAVVTEVLRGADAATVSKRSAPHRSAWLAPVGWRYRHAGCGQAAFVAQSGWIVARQSVVPHLKTQSVAVSQGPVQRLLRLGSVSVHTPDGPVHAEGRHLDEDDARELAHEQIQRARAARTL